MEGDDRSEQGLGFVIPQLVCHFSKAHTAVEAVPDQGAVNAHQKQEEAVGDDRAYRCPQILHPDACALV